MRQERDHLLAQMNDLLESYVRERDPDLLLSDEAVGLAQRVVQSLVEEPAPDLPGLNALGWWHWYRYELLPKGRDQQDLTAALSLLYPVLEADSSAYLSPLVEHLNTVRSLVPVPEGVAGICSDLYELAFACDDIRIWDVAIRALEYALEVTPTHQLRRAKILSQLGVALRNRYEITGKVPDINRAVTVDDEAVTATPTDHPARAALLSNLGFALRNRFEATGNLADLTRSVLVGEEAAAATPPDHPNRAGILSNLGASLLTRYDRIGDVVDLARAIEVDEEAVTATPHDHPARQAALNELGLALLTRAEVTGHWADLDRAIQAAEEAVNATPTDDPGHARRKANLCTALLSRFHRLGIRADLDRAIEVAEEVVDASPTDHPDHAIFLSGLGIALHARFQRTADLVDLDRAIQVAEQAVDATPSEHPSLAGALSELGVALAARSERTKDLEELDRAIRVAARAVATTPMDDPARAGRLSNLSIFQVQRFEFTANAADLDEAIQTGVQAVAASAPDDPDIAGVVKNQGAALLTRFALTKDLSDADRAAALHRQAAEHHAAAPGRRVEAAGGWGEAALLSKNWLEAAHAYESAVELLPRVAPHGLARADQEHQLAKLSGIGPAAGAAFLQAADHDPDPGQAAVFRGRAVELFEQGRGVLMTQMLDSRTDLTDLAEEHPDLADRIRQALVELNHPVPSSASRRGAGMDPQEAARVRAGDADRRRAADAHLQQVLAEVRQEPGFESFLLPRPIADLLPAADSGPIVLVNITDLRCDALILTPAGVQVLPLPKLSPTAVADQVTALLDALTKAQDPAADPASQAAGEYRINGVLGWLWDSITGPILDHLHITDPPDPGQPWPRVYWCPSGLAAFLPLHAAGHHETRFDPRPLTVLDRVVSSTVPTVRALQQARHATAPTPGPDPGREGRVLVVALPHTPGQPDLPGAAAEARLIADLLPGLVDILGLPDTPPATHDTVLGALPGHPWAHFSCHGAADLDDPSSSHLLLTDHHDHPLTVLDLTHTHLPGAQLAFLSACTTARTGVHVPDEPIHLAAACQLAGYPHVIATLWPIHDTDAVRLTEEVYRDLAPTAPSTDGAAQALHMATRGLRNLRPHQPSRWAAHTHTGP